MVPEWTKEADPLNTSFLLLFFAGLGMASPSLMWVSQSLVLNGDCSMAVRIAHEISHSWFGLILGPKDWTEEWISEVKIMIFTLDFFKVIFFK